MGLAGFIEAGASRLPDHLPRASAMSSDWGDGVLNAEAGFGVRQGRIE
jgi:hypothetical protein